MSEYFDVCPECKKEGDVTPKTLFICGHCGRLLCQTHRDARIVYIPTLEGEPLEKTEWGKAVLLELQRKNTHPCFAYTHLFWENFGTQSKLELVTRNRALDYLAHHPSFRKPLEEAVEEEKFIEQKVTGVCHPQSRPNPSERPEPMEIPIPIKRQKHFPLRKAIILSIVALLIGVLVWVLPHFLSTNPNLVSPSSSTTSSLPSTAPSSTPTLPSATPTSTVLETPNREELVNYVLSLINSDRQSHGLQNVTLSSVDSAQLHAESMLANNFFSHWDTNGYKPYMRYTIAGGKGAVAENCAAHLGSYSDIKEALKGMEWRMMYDDADSNWGHRDNILDPLHNRVSIGIAHDNRNVYLVQDFENDYIIWNILNVDNNQVNLQGTIQGQQSDIQQIAIFYDNPTPLTPNQLKQSPYQGGYDAGTYIGLALPQNWQATGGITLTADNWIQSGNIFQISFSLSQAVTAYGKGVYTLYLQTGSSTADALLTYSIWIS